MKRFIAIALTVVTLAIACGDVEARGWFRRSRGGSSYGAVPAGCSNSTAQGVAEIQAKLGRLH